MKRVALFLAVITSIFVAAPVAAQSAAPSTPTILAATCQDGIGGFLGLRTWDACLNHDASGAPQLTGLSDVWLIILPLLEDAIKVAGYVAAGFVIWGGIKYLKSQGDPTELTASRQTIYNALFGLVLVMLSVAIVNFVAGAL